ncbi:DNA damage-regulated autophagy modulator protein 1 [Brachionichthys hirsutus]|uniref:DNA damage-regulated autophagy modulator protein 1 n=1 Tax=Brachionichthys hirsutus TaxID=412623 RepID=UPI003604B55D
MFWFTQGLCFLPAFLVVWSSSTFIIAYLIALLRHDVDAVFPYISDTGANPPESCIFGLMTFIAACAAAATVYSRYKYVEKLTRESNVLKASLNKAALVLGMISCLGMCVVATFQETAVEAVHDVGALLFFVPGVVYTILQSVISYRVFPFRSSVCLCRARLTIAVVATVALFPTAICAYFGRQPTLHRDTKDEGYPFYLASAICEWIVAFSFIFFFLTYIDDFKLFTLQVITEYEE